MQKIGPNGDRKSAVATLDGRSRKNNGFNFRRALTAMPNVYTYIMSDSTNTKVGNIL